MTISNVYTCFISADHNLDINSLGYCDAAISSTMKAFFKLLPDPLISDDIAAKVLVINCECAENVVILHSPNQALHNCVLACKPV